MSNTHALLLVLARAGSKGLPDKNITPLASKPLLAWTLDHAQATADALANRTLVALSTDSPHYLDLAKQHHPDTATILRPADLASDAATVDAAARHAVTTLEAERDTTFTHVAILYANVPLRPADLTARAIAKLLDTGCDSVQSLCPVGKHHPYWMKTLAGDSGDVLTPYVDNAVYRRQDLPPVYQLDGGVLAVTRDSLFTTADGQPHAFLGQDRRAITTAPGEVVDIDTPIDLALAAATLAARHDDA
ncbi:MAG: acylneuraminate cytidylyltransferase family protein [Planctomycetota bacterium]